MKSILNVLEGLGMGIIVATIFGSSRNGNYVPAGLFHGRFVK